MQEQHQPPGPYTTSLFSFHVKPAFNEQSARQANPRFTLRHRQVHVSRETDPLSTFSSRDVAIARRTQHHTDCRQTAYDPSKTGLHRRLRWLCHSGLSARPLGEGSPANAHRCVIPGSRPQYSAYMHGLLQSEVQIRFDRHSSFSVSRENGSPTALAMAGGATSTAASRRTERPTFQDRCPKGHASSCFT